MFVEKMLSSLFQLFINGPKSDIMNKCENHQNFTFPIQLIDIFFSLLAAYIPLKVLGFLMAEVLTEVECIETFQPTEYSVHNQHKKL